MPRSNYDVRIPGRVKVEKVNGSISNNYTPPDCLRSTETSTGVSRRKPSGWIPPTGYSLSFRKVQLAVGRCHTVISPNDIGNSYVYTGAVGAPTFGRFNSNTHFDELIGEGSIIDPTLANRSLIAARNKVKQSSINLGVAFAERKRTSQLLGDTAINIGKSIRALKRGEVRRAMNALGISSSKREPRGSNVPQKWLELQYGWKPLLSDVYGACDALSKRHKRDWRVTAKATISSKKVYTRKWYTFESGDGRAEVNSSVFTRIDALPQNEALISLSSMGITNPLLIGWELVPFSFVVDWALPVGKWLESLDSMLGYTSCYTSQSSFTRAEWWGVGRYDKREVGFHDNQYDEYKYVVKLVRTATSGVPLPSFPGIKDPSSLGHMANGLALLTQAFGRR